MSVSAIQQSESAIHTHTTTTKSLQSCPTLCDPMDCSLPGFSVHGILQARTLEWVAISFSSAWKWKVKVNSLSRVWLLATPWTAAYQAPPSMGFSGQQYWSGVPLPSPIHTHIPPFLDSHNENLHWVEKTVCIALWWPKWEGDPKKGVYVLYVNPNFPICFTSSSHLVIHMFILYVCVSFLLWK